MLTTDMQIDRIIANKLAINRTGMLSMTCISMRLMSSAVRFTRVSCDPSFALTSAALLALCESQYI